MSRFRERDAERSTVVESLPEEAPSEALLPRLSAYVSPVRRQSLSKVYVAFEFSIAFLTLSSFPSADSRDCVVLSPEEPSAFKKSFPVTWI